MFPQLNLSSGNEPRRSSRVAHGSSSGGGSIDSFSGSDGGSVGQASSSSGKFEDAMEMYQQSMAIRRRKMSMSSATAANSAECNSEHSSELSTVQTSPSLRGPQLRPTTRLTRVDLSHGASLPLQQHQQQQTQRPAHRLPSLISQTQLPRPQLSSSAPPAAAAPTAMVSEPKELLQRRDSAASTASLSSSMAVVRRSTRRPLSRNRTHSPPLVSAAGASWDKLAGSSSSLLDVDAVDDVQRQPSYLTRDLAPANAKAGGHHTENALGGSFHRSTRSSSANEPYRQAMQGPYGFQSHGGSSIISNATTHHATTQAPRREHSAGVRSEASQNASGGSYDVMGLDSMLMASQDDAAALQGLSLHMHVPTQPRHPHAPPSSQEPPQPASSSLLSTASSQQTQKKAGDAAATSSPRHFSRRASASPATSSSLLKIGLPLHTPPTNKTATGAAAAPNLSASSSFELPSLRVPSGRATAAAATSTTRSTSHATTFSKVKMEGNTNTFINNNNNNNNNNTGRSASQAGLSSAVITSESRNGSRATCETSRRELGSNSSLLPHHHHHQQQQQQQHTPTTLMELATSASRAIIDGSNGRVSMPADVSSTTTTTTTNPVAATTTAAHSDGIDEVPQPAVPPLTPLSEKQTAQFYNTASLAKTYDGAQFLNDYILIGEIGSGATGRVVLAFSTGMMCSVAIKIIQKPKEKKYRLQRQRGSSDSSAAFSNLSERRNSNEAGQKGVETRHAVTDGPIRSQIPHSETAASPSTAAAVSDAPPPPPPLTRSRVSQARLTTAERMTRNLQREIDVMKDLHHPNIVRLFEVINDPKANSLFLILQYVDSGAVAQLNSSGCIAAPFAPEDLLPIATQVIDGLVYLHEHRIVHRDIKPENILVNRDGQAFLADFGVAELMNAESGLPTAATLAFQGTPLFMAPEIYAVDEDDDVDVEEVNVDGDDDGDGKRGDVRSGDADAAATAPSSYTGRRSTGTTGRASPRTIDPYALDVWALGVTFYTLLLGRVPFNSITQIRHTVSAGVSIPSAVPEDWRNVLLRTMAPNVDQRVSSAQLKAMLHAMLDASNANAIERDGDGDNVSGGSSAPRKEKGSVTARDGRGGAGQRRRESTRTPVPPVPPAASGRRTRGGMDKEEDVILGCGTPPETTFAFGHNVRVAEDFDDLDCTFSINSSVMDVLRPSKR